VRLFFEWDPLVALVNALAGHALYRGLIWCLIILVPTLFLGRFFCGWICPMGTLQHFVGNMPSEAKRGKQRIEANRYKRWQIRCADCRTGRRLLRFGGHRLA
jgi:polyferredoxin